MGIDHADLRAAAPEVTATLGFPGATDTAVFETYVAEVLAPELKPGDVVIWDNFKPHESGDVVESASARVVPLSPWSPDLTTNEEISSKIEGAMRKAAVRTTEVVYAVFGFALHNVTSEGIAGWFLDRVAYPMQQ